MAELLFSTSWAIKQVERAILADELTGKFVTMAPDMSQPDGEGKDSATLRRNKSTTKKVIIVRTRVSSLRSIQHNGFGGLIEIATLETGETCHFISPAILASLMAKFQYFASIHML